MLLQEAEKETAFLKAGILGFAGTGKTHTAMLIALGIIKKLNSKKPLAFLDTETGSDFWVGRCQKEGIKMIRTKRRTFQDLMIVVEEAEKSCDVLIIDSISHIWKDFIEGYMKRLNRTRLQFQDWNVIKPEWGRFTDRFLNSRLHIIMCGRAGWEYDYFENEETHQKELYKTGTKMKAESEMGYEPSLLLEMERIKNSDNARVKKGKAPQIGGEWIHRCHVLKDRADLINGKVFDNPAFDNFLPVFNDLNIGGVHIGIDTSHSSAEVFDEVGRTERARKEQTRKQLLEEIDGVLTKEFPSTGATDKKARLEVLTMVFGTTSKTKIENKLTQELEAGLGKIYDLMADTEMWKKFKEKENKE